MNNEYEKNYKENLSSIERKIYEFDYLSEIFHKQFEPYITVIGNYYVEQRLKGKKLPKKLLAKVLGISYATFQVMEKVFPEIEETLELKESAMGLKAQIDLQKGILLKPTSAKLLTTQLERYDEDFKAKEGEHIQAPTLVFEVKNASLSDEELKEKAPKLE